MVFFGSPLATIIGKTRNPSLNKRLSRVGSWLLSIDSGDTTLLIVASEADKDVILEVMAFCGSVMLEYGTENWLSLSRRKNTFVFKLLLVAVKNPFNVLTIDVRLKFEESQ